MNTCMRTTHITRTGSLTRRSAILQSGWRNAVRDPLWYGLKTHAERDQQQPCDNVTSEIVNKHCFKDKFTFGEPQYQGVFKWGLELEADQTHVWWLYTKEACDLSLLKLYENILSPSELHLVAQAGCEEVKRERLLARVLVRTTLCKYLPKAKPRDITFSTNKYGKPFLINSRDDSSAVLEFSLSHTKDLIGIAVSRGAAVGLDVELKERATKINPLKLAKRRFSDVEFQHLQGIGDHNSRSARFVELWTLKESYVKARGTGINAPPGLKGFSILFQDTQPPDPQRIWPSQRHDTSAVPQKCAAPVPHSLHRHDSLRLSCLPDCPLPRTARPLQFQARGSTMMSGSTIADACEDVDLLLFQPDDAHVAALCVTRDAAVHQQYMCSHAQGEAAVRDTDGVAEDCEAVRVRGEGRRGAGRRVRWWKTLPGVYEEGLPGPMEVLGGTVL